MKVTINNNSKDVIEARSITIESLGSEFRISVNASGEIVVNKINDGFGDSSMLVKPSMSNEIRIM